MITKDLVEKRACLFCASDYHLEMILLPYIEEHIESNKFVILTQNDLEESIRVVLERVNLDNIKKDKIFNLNWKQKNIRDIEKIINDNKNIIVIVNGDEKYIRDTNSEINKIINKEIETVDCFHIGDVHMDINEVSKNYKVILNTRKF